MHFHAPPHCSFCFIIHSCSILVTSNNIILSYFCPGSMQHIPTMNKVRSGILIVLVMCWLIGWHLAMLLLLLSDRCWTTTWTEVSTAVTWTAALVLWSLLSTSSSFASWRWHLLLRTLTRHLSISNTFNLLLHPLLLIVISLWLTWSGIMFAFPATFSKTSTLLFHTLSTLC